MGHSVITNSFQHTISGIPIIHLSLQGQTGMHTGLTCGEALFSRSLILRAVLLLLTLSPMTLIAALAPTPWTTKELLAPAMTAAALPAPLLQRLLAAPQPGF